MELVQLNFFLLFFFVLQGSYEDSDYIVVPQEDILRSNEDSKLTANNPDAENAANLSEFLEQVF